MIFQLPWRTRAGALVFALLSAAHADVGFTRTSGAVEIRIDDKQFATYRWADPEIARPYFCNVYAPNGTVVTRTHPPDPVINKDNADHETMHPGIWLAFGDVNGLDVWRNKARVRHVRFAQEPDTDDTHGYFTVVNAYEPLEGSSAAGIQEVCKYDIYPLDMGWFLIAQSVFRPAAAGFRFGDQEEMGLGVRVNTPITVKFGSGALLNSEGGRNEYGTWGQRAKWCSAFGSVNGSIAGLTVMPGPGNFRQSWFHSRDYGLIVANPFGKKAMTAAEKPEVAPDVTPVAPGEEFRLAFGVFVFSGETPPDNATAYEWFQELLGQSEPPAAIAP
ncbi:MAG: DUF6807 family protein [Candidatus Hydrogenedentes bacterium]|nr:DUF6807 family protein [Candidatus Hydrogenedentota bacterium]